MSDLSVFPISEITATNVNNTEATYCGYVKNLVDAILVDNAITHFNGQAFTKPTPKPPSIERTSSNPITVAVNQQETLTGRAVFVDYLSADLLSKIKTKKDALQDIYQVSLTVLRSGSYQSGASLHAYCNHNSIRWMVSTR